MGACRNRRETRRVHPPMNDAIRPPNQGQAMNAQIAGLDGGLILTTIGPIAVSTCAVPSSGGMALYKTTVTQPSLNKTIDVKGAWLVACNPALLTPYAQLCAAAKMHDAVVAEVKASLQHKTKSPP